MGCCRHPTLGSGSGRGKVVFEEQGFVLESVAPVETQRLRIRGHHAERDLGASVVAGASDHLVEHERTGPLAASVRLDDELTHQARVGGMLQAGAKGEAHQAEDLFAAHGQQNLADALAKDLGDVPGGDRAALVQVGRQRGDQAGNRRGVLRISRAQRDGREV